MPEVKPKVTGHAKVVAIVWVSLLIGVWFFESGYQPLSKAYSQLDRNSWQNGQNIRLIEKTFADEMQTFEKIRPYYNWANFWTFGQSNGLVVRGKNDWMYYRALFNPPGNNKEVQKDFLNLFKQVDRGFKEMGCQVYWLPVPEKAMIHPYYPEEVAERVKVREENLHQFIHRAQKMGLQVIDLLPGYKAQAAKGTSIFFPDDTHWSLAGMNAAIEEVLKAINATMPLKPQSIKITSETVRRYSDLPVMLNFPKTTIDQHHLREINIPRVAGISPPQIVFFGTSFSYSFGMTDHLAQAAQVVAENHAFAALVIPDLLFSALDRLEHGSDLQPGTAVVFEFPYRLLNRTDDLSDLKVQFQWQRLLGNQLPQRTLDHQELQLQNLEFITTWRATNNQPMIFINEPILSSVSDPKFLKVRYKSPIPLNQKTRLKVFYDLGEGFKGHIHKNFYLSNTHSWQTWLIPVQFKQQVPKRIRIDFMNQTHFFKLAPFEIY